MADTVAVAFYIEWILISGTPLGGTTDPGLKFAAALLTILAKLVDAESIWQRHVQALALQT